VTRRARRLLDALEAGSALIPLYARGPRLVDHALVDEENFEELMFLRWYRTAWGYACATFTIHGRPKEAIFMHRAVLGLFKGDKEQGDHINGDRLDNRRANLRIVTIAENRQNQAARGGTSPHRGVSWSAKEGRWVAQAKCNGLYYCERFDDEEQAARAVSAWREAHMPFTNEARA